MHKRIEFVVRNPGYEGTDSAMGTLTIDFEDEKAYQFARIIIGSQLMVKGSKQLSVGFDNERGEQLAFNPAYYVSHRISDVLDWHPTWLLPADGSPPPRREID